MIFVIVKATPDNSGMELFPDILWWQKENMRLLVFFCHSFH